MKIAVLCSGTVLQPALETLHFQGLLAGVAVPEGGMPIDIHRHLEMAIRQAHIPFLRVPRVELERQLADWLREIAPDAVCCMGFPWKIPRSVLDVPRLGFFNFHGGLLPQYRGPDPVFWQIRNGETCGAVSIHRMTAEVDRGGLAHAERIPIGPDETYGLHMQRLGATLPRIVIEFVQQLVVRGADLPLTEQAEATAQYRPRPTDPDRTVDWSRPVSEIDALVRACNPIYGGALTMLKGIPVRLLQVTAGPCAEGSLAGTILAASIQEGIRVACGQGETLFVDMVYSQDGFFTGGRLVKIFGLRAGDRMS